MLIQLANEVWMEILGWLKREKLAYLLDQLPGDRQFTEIVQTWLHEIDKVQLRSLSYDKLWMDEPASLYRCDPSEHWHYVPIAREPMPENIVDFVLLEIRYLDKTILDFLHLAKRLFTNINLDYRFYERLQLDSDDDSSSDEDAIDFKWGDFSGQGIKQKAANVQLENTKTALKHLVPFFQTINSISCSEFRYCCQFLLLLRDNFPAILFGARLIHLEIYSVEEAAADLLADWLCTPREDGQPRVLIIGPIHDDSIMICQKIRKRFVAATGPPVPFFFRTPSTLDEESTMQNEVTDEQLVSRNVEHEYEEEEDEWGRPLKKKVKKTKKYALMSRCSSGVNKAWMEEEERKILGWQYEEGRQIWLAGPKIGQIGEEHLAANMK